MKKKNIIIYWVATLRLPLSMLFFLMWDTMYAHLICGDVANEFFGPVLLLILTVVSWHFRPNGRKLIPANL